MPHASTPRDRPHHFDASSGAKPTVSHSIEISRIIRKASFRARLLRRRRRHQPSQLHNELSREQDNGVPHKGTPLLPLPDRASACPPTVAQSTLMDRAESASIYRGAHAPSTTAQAQSSRKQTASARAQSVHPGRRGGRAARQHKGPPSLNARFRMGIAHAPPGNSRPVRHVQGEHLPLLARTQQIARTRGRPPVSQSISVAAPPVPTVVVPFTPRQVAQARRAAAPRRCLSIDSSTWGSDLGELGPPCTLR